MLCHSVFGENGDHLYRRINYIECKMDLGQISFTAFNAFTVLFAVYSFHLTDSLLLIHVFIPLSALMHWSLICIN
jgi:hypothetical protein